MSQQPLQPSTKENRPPSTLSANICPHGRPYSRPCQQCANLAIASIRTSPSPPQRGTATVPHVATPRPSPIDTNTRFHPYTRPPLPEAAPRRGAGFQPVTRIDWGVAYITEIQRLNAALESANRLNRLLRHERDIFSAAYDGAITRAYQYQRSVEHRVADPDPHREPRGPLQPPVAAPAGVRPVVDLAALSAAARLPESNARNEPVPSPPSPSRAIAERVAKRRRARRALGRRPSRSSSPRVVGDTSSGAPSGIGRT